MSKADDMTAGCRGDFWVKGCLTIGPGRPISPLSPFSPAAPCNTNGQCHYNSAGPAAIQIAMKVMEKPASVVLIRCWATTGPQNSFSVPWQRTCSCLEVYLRDMSTFVNLFWQLLDSSILSPFLIAHPLQSCCAQVGAKRQTIHIV